MKTSTLLFAASLVANGALAVALFLSPPVPAIASRMSAVTPGGAARPVSGAPAAASTVAVPVANLWSRLHSDNLDQFRDRLRAAGFPPKTVRSMLAMAITQETQERREALDGKWEDMPYWKQPRYSGAPEHQMQRLEIYRDQTALMYKYVSGPDSLAEDPEELNAVKRRYGNLPLEKLQRLMAIDHDDEEAHLQRGARYADQPPTPERMRALSEELQAQQKAKHAAVAGLLSPDELEQYELRNEAGGLRQQLAVFRPTEEEFRAIHTLLKNSGDDRAQWIAKAQALLGPERYADYLASMTSDGTGKLGQLIGRLELPASTITTVNGVRDDINQRAQIINNDSALSADQRASQLAALAQEANDRLTSTLGPRGYAAYSDLKGDWIRALKSKGTNPGGP